MLIFKMLSHLTTAMVAFAIGTGIVTGARYAFSTQMDKSAISTPVNKEGRTLSGCCADGKRHNRH